MADKAEMNQPDRRKSGIQPRKEVPVNDRIVKALVFISIAVQFAGAQFNPQDLGGTISEALYMAKELPSVNKPEYLAPNGIAASKDHKTLYITAEAARQLLVYDVVAQTVTRRIDLPASPTGLVVSPDGSEIYVTCMSEFLPVGVVAVVSAGGIKVARTFEVGHSPRSPVVSADGAVLYVCNRFENAVRAFEAETGNLKWKANVEREPYRSMLMPNGIGLLVANYLHSGRNNLDTVAAVVTILDAVSGALIKSVPLTDGAQSCAGIEISDDNGYAYISHIRSLHTMTPLTHIRAGWINANAVSIIDLAQLEYRGCFLLDNSGAGAANPREMVIRNNTMYVAVAGSREIHTINLVRLHDKMKEVNFKEDGSYSLSFSIDFVSRTTAKVEDGRTLALLGDTVFLVGYFSDNIEILEAQEETVRHIGIVNLGGKGISEEDSPGVRVGEWNFHRAEGLCYEEWQSCASCHPDGRITGLRWDMRLTGQGNYKDTRSPLLSGVTPPNMINGLLDSLIRTVEHKVEYVLYADASSVVTHVESIVEYLEGLRPFPSPALTRDGRSLNATRGRTVFEKFGCNSCHIDSTYFTDRQLHEGYKGLADTGPYDGNWDTPTLHEVWRTAPYMHNGGCSTLKDVFLPPYNHGVEDQTITDQQLNDLVEYLKTL